MNKVLEIYTEIDCIYDPRRGLLSLLMTPDITDDAERVKQGNALWDLHVADNYKERQIDYFNYPFFNIDRVKYEAAWKKRSISDWLMYYPSNFYNDFIRTVVELEQLDEKPVAIKTVNLNVNTFPYDFDQAMLDDFVLHCKAAFKGLVTVKTFKSDPAKMDSLYYKQFRYVFKYDSLIGEDSRLLIESLGKNPIPNTAFVVPDILAQKLDTFTGSVSDLIFSMSMSLGTAITLVPIKHRFFDYAEA
jgi:hypothetical protein